MPRRPPRTTLITTWLPDRSHLAGWASHQLAGVTPPRQTDLDARAFNATLVALAQDLDLLWEDVVRSWPHDLRLCEELRATLARVAEGYGREAAVAPTRWARVARGRRAAWLAALDAFDAEITRRTGRPAPPLPISAQQQAETEAAAAALVEAEAAAGSLVEA